MRKICIVCSALYFLFFFSINSYSQKDTYVTTQYSAKDGLPHNKVSSLTFDKQGFLWISTANGLFRYNGYEFDEYAKIKADTNIINSPSLKSVLADSKGNIWAGYSANGVSRYNTIDQSTLSFFPDFKDLKAVVAGPISTVCEDKEGNIWIGSSTNGISKFNTKNNTFKHYLRNKTKLGEWTGANISKIICTKDSTIWVAAINCLYKYDKAKDEFKPKNITKKRKGNNFATIAEDTLRNCIWLGRWGNLIAKVNLKTEKGKWIRAYYGSISAIHPDPKGFLWLGTWGNGLYRYNPKSKKGEKHNFEGDSAKINNVKVITDIKTNKSGTIWLSTNNSGILSITKSKTFKKFKIPKRKDSETNVNDIRYFNNKLFIATSQGVLFKNDSGNLQYIKGKRTYIEKLVALDSLLLATTQEKITFLEKKDDIYKLKKFDLFNRGARNDYRKVTNVIRRDSLIYLSSIQFPMTYFGERDGSFWFRNRFEPRSKVDGYIATSQVNCMFKDSKEKIWVGSFSGLYQIVGREKMVPAHRFISNGKHLSSDLVTEIKEDSKGRLLLCTGKGLNVLTPIDSKHYSLSVYDISNGLPENNVRSCSVDANGIVWLSTNTNIVRIDLENKDVYALGKRDGINVSSFTRSSAVSPNGNILFGGQGCYIEFAPSEIKVVKRKPTLELSKLSILNTPIKAGDEFQGRVILEKSISHTNQLEITYKEKEFSIELSLLEYQKDKKNFYEYKLVGFDKDWIQLGRQRTVSFTNLPAGKYELQARAITSEGIYIELQHPLSIAVTPPWWKTVWFRTTFILSIIIAAVAYYKYRMRAIEEKNRELERQVAIRTQEIRQQSEEIKTQRDSLVEQKARLEDANQLLKERQEDILMQNEEIQQQAEEITAQRDYVKKQNQEIEEGLKNMELLSEFGQKLTSTLSLSTILQMVHNYVASIVKTDAFGVGLYRDKKKRIDYHAFFEDGESVDLFSRTHNPQKSFSSWAIENKKEIFENSISKNFQLYFNETPSLNTSFEAKSILVFPLFSEEKVIGVFSVYSREEDSYLQKDFSFVKSLSAYISIAVANARLYGEMNRKNENIQSSIAYARNIQEAILPLKQSMNSFVKTFTLFMPKAVVSGDFYWHTDLSYGDKEEGVFAVVDCTGHGVPGAFMSLIGNRILNHIVIEKGVHDPANVLTELDKFVIEALKQKTTENNDGMDVALCKVTKTAKGITVTYAGAKRNLIIIDSKGEINIAKGTRKSIGGTRSRKNGKHFTSEIIELSKDTTLYLTSDGYADQNGINESKFGSTMLIEYLSQIHKESMEEQAHMLKKTLLEHMGDFEQRDDITIMGIKI